MKRQVNIAEAKATLSALINEVAYGGEHILLLSRGKPKAALVGIEDLKRLEGGLIASTRSEVLKKAATLRKKIAFGGRKIRPVEEDLAKIREGV